MADIYSVAVIGGGASGMAAAISAARFPHSSVIVLERGARVGKKLLVTGNGRCNLSNLSASEADYGVDGKIASEIVKKLPYSAIEKWFGDIGLLCKTETDGRVYPYCEQASAVLDVLRLEMARLNVEERCEFDASSVVKSKGIFRISSQSGDIVLAKRVIIACGGAAAPSNGGCTGGYALLKNCGHTVRKIYPSLVPIAVDRPRMKALKGVRCKACATLLHNGQTIASELGEVQFTEEALSGICIFQLSRFIGRFAASQQKGNGNIKGFEVSLSLISDISKEEIMRLLINRKKTNPTLPADQLLVGILNKKIAYEILRDAVIGLSEKTVSQVGSAELEKIAELCTDWRFTVTGTLDMRNAQVTGGGAKLGEFNTNTLESKKINGLFACGEVLDVDAICGGYNLHWAWSSGITAGTSAGRIEG